MLTDSYKHKGLRKKLLEELKKMGISDQKVLDAMNAVPRHYFLSSAFLEFAYENKAFQIGAGQTISHPFTVATQTQLLKVEPGMKVLEIGTGSGYQASILAQIVKEVYTIEIVLPLSKSAEKRIKELGYTNVH